MKQVKQMFSLRPVMLLVLYLVNLAGIVFFEIAFLHTLPAPSDSLTLSQMEHFSESTILDQLGLAPDGAHAESIYVLYQTKEEDVALVQIECSLYSDRCRILEDEIVFIPNDASDFQYEFSQLLGCNVITVSNGNQISGISQKGIVRSSSNAAIAYSLTAIVLWIFELAVINILSNIIMRKGRNAA